MLAPVPPGAIATVAAAARTNAIDLAILADEPTAAVFVEEAEAAIIVSRSRVIDPNRDCWAVWMKVPVIIFAHIPLHRADPSAVRFADSPQCRLTSQLRAAQFACHRLFWQGNLAPSRKHHREVGEVALERLVVPPVPAPIRAPVHALRLRWEGIENTCAAPETFPDLLCLAQGSMPPIFPLAFVCEMAAPQLQREAAGQMDALLAAK